MMLKKAICLGALGILVSSLLFKVSYAAEDILGGIWNAIEGILPYLLTSPLLLILLIKFWGVPLVEVILKLKWVVVMVVPTIVLYVSMPEIINYASIRPPEWFMYISPPLVIDCVIGYAMATGNSTYLTVGLVWLMSVYFISIFLILSEKRRATDEVATKKAKSNYYYIFSPIFVWIILAMWGMLMINVHTFVFTGIGGALSAELFGGTGLQVGVLIAIFLGIIIVFLILGKIRSSKNPEKNMTLLYCKEIEGKVVCVYNPKKDKKEKKDGQKREGKEKKKKKKRKKKKNDDEKDKRYLFGK